jgi:hypothetical protein
MRDLSGWAVSVARLVAQLDKRGILRGGRSMKLCGSADFSGTLTNIREFRNFEVGRELSKSSRLLMTFGNGGSAGKHTRGTCQIANRGYGEEIYNG